MMQETSETGGARKMPRYDGDTYSTVVVCHPDPESAHALTREMLERFPMFSEQGARVTMIGSGDVSSCGEAARMALESRDLDPGEKIELALELLECATWDACKAVFAKWEMAAVDGDLVDAREQAA